MGGEDLAFFVCDVLTNSDACEDVFFVDFIDEFSKVKVSGVPRFLCHNLFGVGIVLKQRFE